MQVFKLVTPGQVDRILAFDELPADIIRGIKRSPMKGWPRYWQRWFENELKHDFNKEPKPFYILDYKMINADKEKWSTISAYVRKMTPPDYRLMDDIAEMAKPVAKDPYSELDIEPDDMAVIPLVKIQIVKTSESKVEHKEEGPGSAPQPKKARKKPLAVTP